MRDLSKEELKKRNKELEAELAASQGLIRAVQSGEVDVFFTRDSKDSTPFFREGEEKVHRTLLETMEEGIVVTDESGLITFVNKKIAEILDYSPDKMLGKYVYNMFGKKSASCFKKGCNKNKCGDLHTYELNVSTNERKKVSLLINQVPILDKNKKIDSILLTATDISGRTRAEARLSKTIKTLKNLSIVDGLTGIYNHRHFWQRLTQECERSKRHMSNLCLLLIDIDLFKVINDSNGHKFGDFVLKETATILKRNCRKSDIVFRYGGDEFAVLLTDTDYSGANIFAEKIRKSIKAYKFMSSKKITKLTISIGISSLLEDGVANENKFAEFADKALLYAKSTGRNTSVCSKDISKEHIVASADKEKAEEFALKVDMISEGIKRSSIESITALVKAMEARDPYSEEHSTNVMNYSILIAKNMGLPEDEVEVIRNAALMHDVGKIGISDNIILKKGKLTEEERNQIKSHPLLGASMLNDIQFLRKSLSGIRHHHEWCNGNGYPAGLKGSEIPLGARIIAAADSFDAMNSDRPYRDALSSKRIIGGLVNGAGTQFFPEVVYSFLQVIKEYKLLPELSTIEESIEKVRKKTKIKLNV